MSWKKSPPGDHRLLHSWLWGIRDPPAETLVINKTAVAESQKMGIAIVTAVSTQ